MSTDVASALIAKSDQLNADDLIGGPIIIEITKVTNKKTPEQPIVINYVGENGRPWKPSKGMARVLSLVWETTEGAQWVGRSVQLFREPSVRFGKDAVGGIWISHMSHIASATTVSITKTRGVKMNFTVQPLKIAPGAAKAPAGQPTPTIGADEPATVEEIEAAKAVARKGVAALEKWWLAQDATMKKVYAPHKDELKRMAEDADAADPDENFPE